MLRALVLFSVWSVLAVFLGVPLLVWTVATRDTRLLFRWGVWFGGAGLRVAGIGARVRFAAPLDPAQPYIFLSNHASNLDPPLLASVLAPRRTAMLIKRELLRVPLLGWGMRLAGFVPVARSGSVEDAKRSLAEAARVLGSGVSLAIFVEGTRSPDGKLLPFKKGPFFLARESGFPVVPVTLAGTGNLLPKRALRLRAGTAGVIFHAPLDPNAFADRDTLREAVRVAIASGLREMS